MSSQPGGSLSSGPDRDAARRPPAGRWLPAFASALFSLLVLMLAAALVAAVVSYYLVPCQVAEELETYRAECAEYRTVLEERIRLLEETAAGAQTAQSPESPAVPAVGEPEPVAPPPTAPAGGPEFVTSLRAVFALLAGQDRLVWALAEVGRQDWGSAAESVGIAAKTWEQHGFAVLGEQARLCRAELARADPEGTARLRLLLAQAQKALSASVAELQSTALPGAPGPDAPPQ